MKIVFTRRSGTSEKKFEHQVLKALVAERERLGISQRDIATRLGKDFTWVSHLERGKIRLRIDTLIDYAKVLGHQVEIKLDAAAMREKNGKVRLL